MTWCRGFFETSSIDKQRRTHATHATAGHEARHSKPFRDVERQAFGKGVLLRNDRNRKNLTGALSVRRENAVTQPPNFPRFQEIIEQTGYERVEPGARGWTRAAKGGRATPHGAVHFHASEFHRPRLTAHSAH